MKLEFLQEQILENSMPIPESGCWIWLLSTNQGGYGSIRIGDWIERTHRMSYVAFIGPIDNLKVLHKCHIPCCVNPNHLYLGTQTDNMADMRRAGRARYKTPKIQPEEAAKAVDKYGGYMQAGRILGIHPSTLKQAAQAGFRRRSRNQ